MPSLYILCEGDRDDLFFDLLCERVTGTKFDRPLDLRLRHGANWKTAMSTAELLLNRVRHWTDPQENAVVIAVDNDRAPGHPASTPHPGPLVGVDLKKQSRYAGIQKMLHSALGPDRSAWPVDIAPAVPVEMIESWLLVLHNPNRAALPIFSSASQSLPRAYYGSTPPPQLKDLRNHDAAAKNLSLDEYFWSATESDLEAAAAASPSLKMFIDEIRSWRCVDPNIFTN
ncbi:MAG: hypothetical protein WA771_12330 [Chthoniobacterales bacterium]